MKLSFIDGQNLVYGSAADKQLKLISCETTKKINRKI